MGLMARHGRAVGRWRLTLLHTGAWDRMGSWTIGMSRVVPRRGQDETERAVDALRALAAGLMLARLTEPSTVWDLWIFVGDILAVNKVEICKRIWPLLITSLDQMNLFQDDSTW